MQNNIHVAYKKYWFISLIIIGLICVLSIFLEIRNHGLIMSDFEVFYTSASRLVKGLNLYQIEGDGFYVFKYSPTSAVYFTPFSLLPLNSSKVLYWLFLCFLIVIGYALMGKLFLPDLLKNNPLRFNNLIFLAFAAVAMHVIRELYLGQVNWVLLTLYLWMIYAVVNKKYFQASFSLALSLFIKPFGLILIPYLLLKRQTREFLYLLLFTFLLLIIPLVFYDLTSYLGQVNAWFNELVIEMGNKQALEADANHTIFSVIFRYSPLSFIEMSPTAAFIYQLIVLVGLILVVLWYINMGRGIKFATQENMALLVALIPLLAFTNENAFLFITPVIVANLRLFTFMKLFEKVIFIAGIVLQGGNIYELWGKRLCDLFLDYSVVSIGAILIIFVMFSLRYRKPEFSWIK